MAKSVALPTWSCYGKTQKGGTYMRLEPQRHERNPMPIYECDFCGREVDADTSEFNHEWTRHISYDRRGLLNIQHLCPLCSCQKKYK